VCEKVTRKKKHEVTENACWDHALQNYTTFICKEKIHDICRLHSIVRIVKSRKILWTRHVGTIGEIRKAYRIFIKKTS
jgi:hypothetical protein